MADITPRILEKIRDEIIATRIELRQRIDATNERLDECNERLDVVEHTLRGVVVELVALGRHVRSSNQDLRARVAKLEARGRRKPRSRN